jgi:hypothetical protein
MTITKILGVLAIITVILFLDAWPKLSWFDNLKSRAEKRELVVIPGEVDRPIYRDLTNPFTWGGYKGEALLAQRHCAGNFNGESESESPIGILLYYANEQTSLEMSPRPETHWNGI